MNTQRPKWETLVDYTITLDDDPMVSKIIEKATGLSSVAFSSINALISQRESLPAPTSIFIDVHLGPRESGLDAIPAIRSFWRQSSIIVMTADQDDLAVRQALAEGADDFIQKPIKPGELQARYLARLGGSERGGTSNLIHLGDVVIDPSLRTIAGELRKTHLSYTSIKLVVCLFNRLGKVVPKECLKEAVFGPCKVDDLTLERSMTQLKNVIKQTSRTVSIRTVSRAGFKLVASLPGSTKI